MYKKIILLLSLMLMSIYSLAQSPKIQAGYEVHYNVFGSLSLTADVAKNYQISRSANRGFVNLSVLKQGDNDVGIAVEASITIVAKNLLGQSKSIKLKKIAEMDGAIYYVGTFAVSHREVVNFKADVRPKDSKQSILVEFSREFYTD